jgi:hypothetical protein
LLATKNITQQICHQPLRDRTKTISITAVTGVSLAFAAFVLRLLARMMTGQYGMDDWIMIFAMVYRPKIRIYIQSLYNIGLCDPALCTGCCSYVTSCRLHDVTWLVVADRGLGKDIWSIPFDNITYILYVSE